MAKLNTKARTGATVANPNRSTSPIKSTSTKTTTHEKGVAYTRDTKSELFLGLATGFWNEPTFYEPAKNRSDRLVQLMRTVAVGDPDWYLRFVTWLRGNGNIRTASIVAAAEGADAQTKAGIFGHSRTLVNAAIQRADEPGEFAAYWRLNLRSSLPGGVQRGLQDRIEALYDEYAVLKYDTASKGYRFGDVVNLARPAAKTEYRDVLHKFLIDRRKHSDEEIPDALTMVRANRGLLAELREDRDRVMAQPDIQARFREAGMTWEQTGGTGKMDAKAWEAVIPTMGYMALLRNLRNFEDANISDASRALITAKLGDEAQVKKSRQLPYRFASAYLEIQNADWLNAIEKALNYSTQNIPELPGKTVVLVDTSGSMTGMGMSGKSKMTMMGIGALFGIALAAKNGGAKLYGFANGDRPYELKVARGASVLRETERFIKLGHPDGHGTNITGALEKVYGLNTDAARIVIVSDMQCAIGNVGGGGWGGYGGTYIPATVPASVPVYAFDLRGYASTSMQSAANRHQLGGLTDGTFGLIKTIEAGQAGDWDAIFGPRTVD